MTTKVQSAALGVAVYVVLSLASGFLLSSGGTAATMLVGALSCLIIIAAPVVAVWHYTSTNQATLLPGPGAGLGAATAGVGAVIGTLFGWALQQAGLFPTTDEMMARQRTQMIEQGMSPEEIDRVVELAGSMGDSLLTQLGSSLAMGLLAGAIVGAIAALIFKKGEPDVL